MVPPEPGSHRSINAKNKLRLHPLHPRAAEIVFPPPSPPHVLCQVYDPRGHYLNARRVSLFCQPFSTLPAPALPLEKD